jgi:hypothetical protein
MEVGLAVYINIKPIYSAINLYSTMLRQRIVVRQIGRQMKSKETHSNICPKTIIYGFKCPNPGIVEPAKAYLITKWEIKQKDHITTSIVQHYSAAIGPCSAISSLSCCAIAWADTISARRLSRGVWSP